MIELKQRSARQQIADRTTELQKLRGELSHK